jgi:hypothetical protein
LNIREIFNAAAIVLTFVAFVPYIISTRNGKTKPHVFSWVIWGIATVIVFFAQLADGAGIGAWSIGISGLLTLYIAYLAYRRRADSSVTKIDWVFFILALISLPLWYWTRDPFWAVVILTTVDTLGFAPTFRKAYHAPYDELLLLYVVMTIRNLVSIPALEHYSWTTVLFPAVLSLTCALFIVMVMVRRTMKPKTQTSSQRKVAYGEHA